MTSPLSSFEIAAIAAAHGNGKGYGNTIEGNTIGLNATGDTLPNQTGVLLSSTIGNLIGAGNVISGNADTGIAISSSLANLVEGNFIGTDASGTVGLGNVSYGVNVYGGSSGNTIGGTTSDARNIISNNSTGVAISGVGTTDNVVLGNYIGTDVDGSSALGNTSYGGGVEIYGGASANTVGGTASGAGNVISGNNGGGLGISGVGTSNNVIEGNSVGTNANVTAALPNIGDGISIFGGATNNIVTFFNVLSGNTNDGLDINGTGTTGNIVSENLIGTDLNGTTAIPNLVYGVAIGDSATGNLIGGSTSDSSNVISGNGTDGVLIDGAGTTTNLVAGNWIGTNQTGSFAIPNGTDGVTIDSGASGNSIGYSTPAVQLVVDDPGAPNVISGNHGNGITITGTGSDANSIQGNFIGTDATGTSALANHNDGVSISSGAQDNMVGGLTTAGPAGLPPVDNTLTFNGANQYVTVNSLLQPTSLDITGAITLEAWIDPTSVSVFFGDIITKRVSLSHGDVANYGFRQQDNELEFYFTANGTFQNYFSAPILIANQWQHVAVTFDPTTQNILFYVDGQLITTDTTPYTLTAYSDSPLTLGAVYSNLTEVYPGQLAEIRIWDTARTQTQIVADEARTVTNTDPNLVGYWHFDEGGGTIAHDSSGNGNDGILGGGNPAYAPTWTVLNPGTGNVISGNTNDGVEIEDTGTTGNMVQGNEIGTNFRGTAILANSFIGVAIGSGASSNVIGGTQTGTQNDILSGNAVFDVAIVSYGTSNNMVEGNLIGTDATGTVSLSSNITNNLTAIFNGMLPVNNTIGGPSVADRNIISGNPLYSGVAISDDARNNTVQGNYIGTDITGTVAIPNVDGIDVFNDASGPVASYHTDNNVIEDNLISGNLSRGLIFAQTGVSDNVAIGNLIGTDVTGTLPLPNGTGGTGGLRAGVTVDLGAVNNQIGEIGEGNVIAFNDGAGVFVGMTPTDPAAQATIRGNTIYGNTGIGIDLADDGVTLNASEPRIGPNNFQDFPVITSAYIDTTTGNLVLTGFADPGALIDLYLTDRDPSGFGQGATYLTTLDVSSPSNLRWQHRSVRSGSGGITSSPAARVRWSRFPLLRFRPAPTGNRPGQVHHSRRPRLMATPRNSPATWRSPALRPRRQSPVWRAALTRARPSR